MGDPISTIKSLEKLVAKSDLSGIVTDIVKLLHDEDAAVTNAYKALVGTLGNASEAEGETPAVPHTVKSYVDAAITTVNGENSALAGRVEAIENAKAVAGGLASLDENGHVPSSQLPSFVDDVIEAANFAALPTTGETGKIYVTLDTNLTYRWSGTQYVEISQSLALGETSSTAYAGDKGKANADAIAVINGEGEGSIKAAVKALADGAVKNNADAIDAINNESTGILKTAKDYTDTLANGQVKTNKESIEGILATENQTKDSASIAGAKAFATDAVSTLENGQVKTNKEAIEAINNETTGILKSAKDYADGLAGNYDKSGDAAAVQGNTTLTVADVASAVNSFSVMTADDVAEIKALIK